MRTDQQRYLCGARLTPLTGHAWSSRAAREPSTPPGICCSCGTEFSSRRRSMTGHSERVASRFVCADGVGYWVDRVCVYGRDRVELRASSRTARMLCSRRVFAGTIAPERRSERRPDRARTARRASRPTRPTLMVAITDRHDGSARSLVAGAGPRHDHSRVTSDPASDWFPVWSPDGSRLFFGSGRTGMNHDFSEGRCLTRGSVRGLRQHGCRHLPNRCLSRTGDSCCISSLRVAATTSA